jgi:hypothetical protein
MPAPLQSTPGGIVPLVYDGVDRTDARASDHRPVVAVLKVALRAV